MSGRRGRTECPIRDAYNTFGREAGCSRQPGKSRDELHAPKLIHLLSSFQCNNQMITATGIQRSFVLAPDLITQKQNARSKQSGRV